MRFPAYRLRRLRQHEAFRRMVRETRLAVDDLISPLFVAHGRDVRQEIQAMPGVFRLSIDHAVKEALETKQLGIPAVILFGIPAKKDAVGSEAYDPKGIVQQAVRAIKDSVPGLVVITDCCLDEYTSHGHCGVVQGEKILNDPTLDLLARTAVSHAQAGADMVAPSDMMDGRVMAIRQAMDQAGFTDLPIMAYSAKFASCFYAPFLEAADSAPAFGDRQSYQMDPANAREALREVELDVEEGADIVMVKPALPYLDIIRQVRDRVNRPLAAFSVSGEYAMVKAAARLGWLDERRAIRESLTAIKRAGADLILTYFAKDAARLLRE